MRRLLLIAGVVLLVGVGAHRADAASLLVVAGPSSVDSAAQRALGVAAEFYGVSVERRSPDDRGLGQTIEAGVRSASLVGVVIDANALNTPGAEQARALLEHANPKVPVLLLGIDEKSSPDAIAKWSAGAVTGCTRAQSAEGGWYQFASDPDVNRQLQGIRLRRPGSDLLSLVVPAGSPARHILDANVGGSELPQLVRSTEQGLPVFFATAPSALTIPATVDPYVLQEEFAGLAPEMLFVHFAAGVRGWQSPGAYANFTIDDLWLREPYGHVNYQELLAESERHNFHTTIAFIPWNYDRSQDGVVSLFKQHPDRLSICIHGNDHLHQEFGPLSSHPLDRQEFDVEQAVARMEKFHALTGLPYDRVMVFPHSIAPAATFGLLKKYNYDATANSLNVPSDVEPPTDQQFPLRTVSLKFKDFPSLRRYSAETEIPQEQLAIDAFLGNPILLYAHEAFFSSGINAFDRWADLVNKIEPDTKWASLGTVAGHLYLQRVRDDGGMDIRAYSAGVDLENRTDHEVKYFVTKPEDFQMPLSVRVDGNSYPYEKSGSDLRLSLTIPAGQSRHIAVAYGQPVDWAAVPIEKNSLRINVVRRLSDFRDNDVSRITVGRWFIRSYADNNLAWDLAMVFLFLVLLLSFLYLVRSRRRRHIGSLA